MVYNIVCDNIVPSAIDVESHLPPAGQRLLTSAGGGRRGVSGGRLHVRGARALGHRSAHGAAIAQRGWPWRRLPRKLFYIYVLGPLETTAFQLQRNYIYRLLWCSWRHHCKQNTTINVGIQFFCNVMTTNM